MEEHKTPFSDKGPIGQKITIVEEDKIISDDSEVSECLNNFFRDAVKQLNIKENVHLLNRTETAEDSVDTAIEKIQISSKYTKNKRKCKCNNFQL